ncbi:MAG: tRNA dihydrouridine(20/20a) synthase DusA [Gammaproteobacteria bacterium]|nr:tRNA dihydrouridine(20/20a) synthase DusA [Gammaproteobacteria bacterium]
MVDNNLLNRTISIAPMMDCTDRHYRYFARLITHHTLLYTEMVTQDAIIHGHREKLLDFDPIEKPIALQIGGSDPLKLAECARIGEQWGYDEINLNVGCPSDRVQAGRFGACLMKEPELVKECLSAMKEAVKIPVTIKTRIGVDEQDSYEALKEFVHTLIESGINIFVIHARKAWLKGLSPRQNREVPPLRYDVVYKLKKDFPDLTIVINGGIETLEAVDEHLQHVDAVMLGRAAYHNPYLLSRVDQDFYSDKSTIPTRLQIVEAMLPYIDKHLENGGRLHQITRHMVGLFHGVDGARVWRQKLSKECTKFDSDSSILKKIIARGQI